MTVEVMSYDPAVYSQLPSLGDAVDLFTARGAEEAIYGELKDVLVKHGVTNKFGLALLHIHAEISRDEQLVHFGNAAVPVSSNEVYPTTLLPCTWKVGKNGLLPLEFVFEPENQSSASSTLTEVAFVEELQELLVKLGMEDLIGFSLLANKELGSGGHLPGVEISEGRCNITLPDSTFPAAARNEDDYRDALWVFTPNGHKKCKKACKVRSGWHQEIHHTTNK